MRDARAGGGSSPAWGDSAIRGAQPPDLATHRPARALLCVAGMADDDERRQRTTGTLNPTHQEPHAPMRGIRPRRARTRKWVVTPHDAFFRAIFSRPESALGLLRMMLPESLAAGLDAASVQVISPAHIDGSLRVSQSDVVVAARLFGHEVRFVAILEHRSSVEHRMALRLLRYSGETWAREGPRRGALPDVIPLVVYAGKRPWTAPRDLAGLLAPTDAAALAALRPRFTYLLADLTQMAPADLRAQTLGQLGALALLVLRAVQRDGLRSALADLVPLLAVFRHLHDGPAALTLLLQYLLTVLPTEERPLLHDVVAALPDPEEEDPMKKKIKTIADALREEGAAEARAEFEERLAASERARAESEARGRASTVSKLLRLKFGPLPDAVSERLAQATAAELDGIAERLLFADTLDAALAVG
jgi:hypothetical protein